MSLNTFGWELLHKSEESNIKKEDDVLVLFVHMLLQKKDFQCIGLGESVDIPENAVKTEILPKEWSSGELYGLRYLDTKGKLFILKGIRSDVNIIFNFIRAEDLNVTSMVLKSTNIVKSLESGPLSTTIPNYENIGKQIIKELIEAQDKVEKSNAASTQTEAHSTESTSSTNPLQLPGQPIRDPLMIGEPMRPQRRDPFNYGHSDLDPFAIRGPSGGGMLFDPFSEGSRRFDPSSGLPGPRLPRGAVPPGARFDPFGPPGIVVPPPRRPFGNGPNPDMFPSDDYNDMFM